MDKDKIIIIGGGIGGLMTAIALNKKGISSTIFERGKSFDANGAALSLWGNATSILDKFGLLAKLMPYGNVLNEIRTITSNGKTLKTIRLKKLEEKTHFPSIVLLRSDLQKELLNAIPSSQIQFNKQFIKIENNTNSITVYFADGTFETCNAVIFADGIHSLARQSIFNLPPAEYAGRISWRGIAKFDNNIFVGCTNFEIFGKGRRVGIFPLPNNTAYWYAAVNMSEQEADKQERTIECVLSLFKNWTEPVNSVINNTKEERLILTKLNYSRNITKLVDGNMALLGDAAHPMTPDLGQGACQAIEDAYVLAECLSQNRPIAENLKDYENKRLQRVKSIALNSYRTGNFRQINNSIGVLIRNNLFKILPEKFVLKMLKRIINIKK